MTEIIETRTMLPVSIEVLRDNPVVMERRELAARMEEHANSVAKLINEATTDTDVLVQRFEEPHGPNEPKIPMTGLEVDVLYDLHDRLTSFVAGTVGKLQLHLMSNNLYPYNKPDLPPGHVYEHGFIIAPPHNELKGK